MSRVPTVGLSPIGSPLEPAVRNTLMSRVPTVGLSCMLSPRYPVAVAMQPFDSHPTDQTTIEREGRLA